MNEFRENFNKAMGRLSADRDIVSSAKIRAAERPERKISAKRIFGTAAAVCGVLICGVTAAAATGLIDFNAVFGGYITVEDTELANSLIGTVSNFKYKVSDDDYKISIKGAMGSDGEIVAFAEIKRKDGTPVAEHFVNPVEIGEELGLDNLWSSINIENLEGSGAFGSYLNSDGNIEIGIQFNGERDKKDKKVTAKGENFYPREEYWDFCDEQGVYYMTYGKDFKGYVQRASTYDDIIPVDIDDSSVLALDLEWEFSFVFKASDKSTEIKSLKDPEEDFVYRQRVLKREVQEDGSSVFHSSADDELVLERTATPSYIEIGSTGGKIDFVYEATEYDDFSPESNYSINFNFNNELYIILKDGSRMNADFGASTRKSNGDIMECSSGINYLDENGEKTYVDVDNITALSINGTVYELK